MLPNRTSKTFYANETVYDPIADVVKFSKDFDISKDGDVLITKS